MSGPDALAAELAARGEGVRVERVASVSLVGQGVGSRPRWVKDACALLAGEGIAHEPPFCSSARLTWVVSNDDLERAARALHAAFVFDDA